MADEIKYSGLGDLRASHILHRDLALLLHDPTDLRSTLVEVPWEAKGSSAMKLGQLDVDYAMTAPGEDTIVNNTALVDGSYTLTVAHYTIRFEETFLATITKPDGGYDLERLAQELVSRTHLTMTDIVAALFPSFTTAVSDTGVDLTVDHIYDGMFSLHSALVPGPYYGVFYPQQTNDFVSSLRGETGAVQWRAATDEMLKLRGPGFQGEWGNIQFWSSDSVGTVNGGADSSGAMYGAGAIGYTEADPSSLLKFIPAEARVAGSKVFAQISQIAEYGKQRLTAHYFPAASIAENARGVEMITDR